MKKGWKKESLKDICNIFTDGNWIETKDQSSDGIRLIQTGNIGFGEFKDKSHKSRFISEETFIRLKCTEVLPGDLLVSRLPDPVGKSCIIPDIQSQMITGVDCTIIRPKQHLLSEYLAYYQMSNLYLQDVTEKVTGTTRSRISRKNLGQIEIPIPPITEQKQIVTILDQAFTAIDQAQVNLQQNIENAQNLFQSKLNQIFTHPSTSSGTVQPTNFITNTEDKNTEPVEVWEKKPLGEVCDLIGGGTPSKKEKSYYGGEIFWATVRDMNQDRLTKTDHKITVKGLEKSSSNIIPKARVIIATRVGLGKVCLLEQDTAINQDLKGIVPKPKFETLNDFIFWWYKSIAHKVIGAGTGATVQGVKLKFVKELMFPLIPISEQTKIVNTLKTFSNDINKIKSQYSGKINNLDELKKSILQKAFSGELA